MSPDADGRGILLFAQAGENLPHETVDNFEPIPMYDKARKVEEFLRKDGLTGPLEWVTVPDPYHEEFPFSRRFPGQWAYQSPAASFRPTSNPPAEAVA